VSLASRALQGDMLKQTNTSSTTSLEAYLVWHEQLTEKFNNLGSHEFSGEKLLDRGENCQ